jgi:cyclophilin family peptidyl-prolyl cis-trans isomerase
MERISRLRTDKRADVCERLALDVGHHRVFGRVTDGMDVVDAIERSRAFSWRATAIKTLQEAYPLALRARQAKHL